ncbi:MAG TPA: cupin domain-containing protein [Acidimicrobiales bacterium]|nr:cupin domain-containing protein [Acidimicrobiales bacterium]
MTHLTSAIVRGPGEGRVIPGPEGLTVKAAGDETGGSIGILEATTPPGFGPPRHVHHANDELFYVLEGTFAFLLGDQVVQAGPGSLVFVPRGTVHAPLVVGPGPGRVLLAFVPGGAERAFDEFAALAAELGGHPDPDDPRVRAINDRYDSVFVGPPLELEG